MDELTKSIRAVLYDRIKSPLAGTIFFSWIVWNWRIIVFLFFVSENKVSGTRIDYILKNYADDLHIYWGPLWSALFLVTLFPMISYSFYRLNLEFRKWHKNSKRKVEGETLLTLDESNALRKNIDDEKNRLGKLLVDKDKEIENYKSQIKDYMAQIDGLTQELDNMNEQFDEGSKPLTRDELLAPDPDKDNIAEIELLKSFDLIKSDSSFVAGFEKFKEIKNEGIFRDSVFIMEVKNYFVQKGYIKTEGDNYYSITKKGHNILKAIELQASDKSASDIIKEINESQ